MTAATAGLPLAGRVALVTGGGRGIGRAIATAMSDAGATVVIGSRSAAGFQHGEREIYAVTLDVSREAACREAVEQCQQRFGGLDVLVNNRASPNRRSFSTPPRNCGDGTW